MSSAVKGAIKTALHFPRRLTGRLRRDPNFLIIGAQKAGTTSLHYYLSQHPSVAMSSLKEVHYFDSNYKKGINWYRSYFPLSKIGLIKCVGEASPYYLFHPDTPSRVHASYPNMKIIILLREPGSRALSQYKMERRKGRENLPNFSAALDAENGRMGAAAKRMAENPFELDFGHQAHSYMSRGMYFQQITRWLEYFNKDNFLILESDVLFGEPKKCLARVYDFLEIDQLYPADLSVQNPGSAGKGNPDGLPAEYRSVFMDDQRQLKVLLEKMSYLK